MSIPSSSQHGNVLFLILIAVALFAALSYAVSLSMRSSGNDASRETSAIDTASISEYMSSVTQSINRMMIGQGLQIYQINFNNDVYQRQNGASLYGAMGNPANPSTYLFHARGGGVVPQTFEKYMETTCAVQCNGANVKTGHVGFHWVNLPQVGTTASDAVMVIGHVSPATCLAFNQKLGLTTVPQVNMYQTNLPGSGANSPVVSVIDGPDAAVLNGRHYACAKLASAEFRLIYMLLKEY